MFILPQKYEMEGVNSRVSKRESGVVCAGLAEGRGGGDR